jgi:hypothetical protein
MLPSVIGGPEKRLYGIGFTFCCASKMADPQSSHSARLFVNRTLYERLD